jgi:hypothetical protein
MSVYIRDYLEKKRKARGLEPEHAVTHCEGKVKFLRRIKV